MNGITHVDKQHATALSAGAGNIYHKMEP
jgi:hypothetical protein